MDPPAYTATPTEGSSIVPTPVAPRVRTIPETRALILGNAAVLKPRDRDDEIHLIVAKHAQPQHSAEELVLDQHYAFLVMRRYKEIDVQIVLKGEPKDTIEEALEWMLDKTQTVMEEVLLRHGTHATTSCCINCSRTLRSTRQAKDRTRHSFLPYPQLGYPFQSVFHRH
jgi:hypothetical protein